MDSPWSRLRVIAAEVDAKQSECIRQTLIELIDCRTRISKEIERHKGGINNERWRHLVLLAQIKESEQEAPGAPEATAEHLMAVASYHDCQMTPGLLKALEALQAIIYELTPMQSQRLLTALGVLSADLTRDREACDRLKTAKERLCASNQALRAQLRQP